MRYAPLRHISSRVMTSGPRVFTEEHIERGSGGYLVTKGRVTVVLGEEVMRTKVDEPHLNGSNLPAPGSGWIKVTSKVGLRNYGAEAQPSAT